MKKLLCLMMMLCSLLSYSQEICLDGLDNDGDGLYDCADLDCVSPDCSDAIPCPETSIFYQVLNENEFVKYDPATLTYNTIYSNAYGINAMGYNVHDGYVYGIKTGATNILVRVGSDGVFTELGAVTGLPIPSPGYYFVGDFDLNGVLYVSNFSLLTVHAIDVAAMTATTINLSQALETADFSYNILDGLFYSMIAASGELQTFDPNSGTVTVLGTLAPLPVCSSTYAGAFSDRNGKFYYFCASDGHLHKVDPVEMSNVILQETGNVVSGTDGATCPLSNGLAVTPNGDYCCPGENLVENGSFEDGATGFTNDYSVVTSGMTPTQYTVTDATGVTGLCPNWNAEDPTKCVNGDNGNFLVVNGLTSQAGNSSNIIWEQDVPGIEVDSQYRFCAKFRNLPVCCFDAEPSVRIETSSGVSVPWTLISTDASDACDWQEIAYSFVGIATTEKITIYLDHTPLNDGNDIAIDDIAVLKKQAQDLDLTVEHNGGLDRVTGSINSLTMADDTLISPECDYNWLVAQVVDINTLALTNVQTGGAAAGWGLTTTFPGYNGGTTNGIFEDGKLYIIRLDVADCDCYANEFTYQLTFDYGKNKTNPYQLTAPQINQIKQNLDKMFGESLYEATNLNFSGSSSSAQLFSPASHKEVGAVRGMEVLPNPSSDLINIQFQGIEESGQITLTDVNGKVLKTILKGEGNNSMNVELNKLASGVYIIHLEAEGGSISKRVVKH